MACLKHHRPEFPWLKYHKPYQPPSLDHNVELCFKTGDNSVRVAGICRHCEQRGDACTELQPDALHYVPACHLPPLVRLQRSTQSAVPTLTV